MNPFSSIFNYLLWHYDDGSKVVWKSTRSFLKFSEHAFSTGSIFKMVPTSKINRSANSFFGVAIGSVMHLIALVIKLCASVLAMFISMSAFVGGVIIYILWLIFPFVILLFIVSVVRGVTTSL